ncbi:YhgE/Pip family protein [Cohnella suwonensis]|uniref:YhgE/Pip family protein n=1 Tax=Cohnella suwonensis TaxID=696072 RepID=A0ABW0M0H2_9BACL
MNGLKQYAKELAAIGRNPKLLVPMIAMLMIPVMYSGMFLGAFWNPYGHLDRLPVAVVDSDRGAESNGKAIHIGADFAKKLKEDAAFEYSFVSVEEARQGLEDHTYYMAIEIPADFSEKTATLTSAKPTQAEIVFLPNASSNYLASQIGKNAVEKMRTELGGEVTRAYAQAVLGQFKTLADGLGQASDGAGKLAQGAVDATSGARRIEENLRKLADGAASLNAGARTLTGGAQALDQGAAELQAGAESLVGGLDRLNAGGEALKQGAAEAKGGAERLASGLAQSSAGAVKLDEGAQALAAGLKQYAEAHPELAEDAALKQLIAASAQLAAGAGDAEAGQAALAAGADKLQDGIAKIATGAEGLASGLAQSSAGAGKLADGATSLHDGASRLNGGLTELTGGIGGIADGSGKLDDGAKQMTDGLLKLKDGTGELSGKLADAADKTGSIPGGDAAADVFASPVKLDVVDDGGVANYGTGLAPYFISMGLFVGALLLTVVYSTREPAATPKSGWSWFAGKLLTMVTVGTIQAVIADTILLLGIGLEVRSVPLLFMFSVLTSITFMAIIQFLSASMQNPGRFLAIILLIFQLTSSGGTFPLELTPEWLQNISAWLPMTHTIDGFRAIISSGRYSDMWSDAGMLLIYIAAFALLSVAFYVLSYRRTFGKSGGIKASAEATA